MTNTVVEIEVNKKRMFQYKTLAVAFSYPDKKFFDFFPELSGEKDTFLREYDRLFRAKEIWLYGTEYISEHEFQRSNYLADISGFYKAFGVEIKSDRPDSLEAVLEFMHYLIYKEINAPSAEKARICIYAQRKFFNEYVSPMAKAIAEKVIAQTQDSFYRTIVLEMREFLAEEEKILKK